MKKTIYIAVVAGMLLTLSSCNGYLDKSPENGVNTDMEIAEEEAIALTNAAYQPLQWPKLYNMRMWTLDIISGNSDTGGSGGTDGIETIQLANFTATADNAAALDVWRGPNPGILRCDLVLQKVPGLSISDDIKNRCLGEAYFLRAHYYFILVRLFGDVPLMLTPLTPADELSLPRTSASKIYDQIISDCEKAIELLPAKSSYASSDLGRASKDAALTMLAKVYLTLGKNYDKVVSLCDQVTSLGYDLTKCSYADNFDASIDNNPESIFEIQYTGSTTYDFWTNNNQASWLSTYMGPRNSKFVAGAWGWNLPTQEFVDSYETGDLRKDVTILYAGCPQFDSKTYLASYSSTGYNVRKFLVPFSVSKEYNTNPANFVVYRYADVLLMKAEALNEQGKTTAAETPLNSVRTRAGLASITGETQSAMKETILHERRIELAFEGHRWFDLIRIDNGNYALKFLKSIGKTNVTKDRLLLPIPQEEMDANPNMTQNAGY
jgi:starch-binding outer membrane protein, SusD/RagB family